MRSAVLALAALAFASTAEAACRGADGQAPDFGGRTIFLWHSEALAAQKARIDKDPNSVPAFGALIRDADKALAEGPWSVVDKTRTPPSGDKHDYMSMAPYYWPDPSKPDGLPYIGRDGEVNPERATDAYDRMRLGHMASAVQTLGLAYYFTGERKYAERAALVLRTWFLVPATRMNPSLTFAQGVPGKVPGRGTGIIDTAELLPVVDAVGLLQPSGALSDDDMKGLRGWFGAYAGWLQTSDNGKAEQAATNNHGIWYDLQLSDYALFAGKIDVARTGIAAFAATRIAPQFTADGALPRELARTRSFHYATWTMQAVYDIATLGECVGVDLWSYQSPDGKSLRRNTDFMARYAGHEDQWAWKEIDMNKQDLYDALVRASWGYRDASLGARARAVGDYGAARITLTTPPYRP
jgi:hypothetical protein